MMVVGQAKVRGPADSVWEALHDVVVLARAIPGCEEFEVVGPGLAQCVASTALPAISGIYAAKLTAAQQQRPGLLTVVVAATGDQGSIAADVTVRLSDDADGTTLVSYEVDGTVTGPIGGVGTRLLISAAKRLATEFFDGIDHAVAEPAPSSAPLTSAAEVRPVEEPREAVRSDRSADRRIELAAGAGIGLAGIVVGVLIGRSRAR